MTVLIKGWNYQNDSLKSILSSMFLLSQMFVPACVALLAIYGISTEVLLKEDFARYVSTVAIFANSSFHTKLHVVVCILSPPLKVNLIKTTAFMAFLGKSINILNHRAQKID